jgi:Arc/MetJ family transcription regulator
LGPVPFWNPAVTPFDPVPLWRPVYQPLRYGPVAPSFVWVKTTVELDEKKLLRIMALTGLKTRKAAIDYALPQAERAAKLAKLFAQPWTQQELDAALEPGYDLDALRERDKPAHAD